MLIECPNINQEFVTVYIIAREINLEELQLQEKQRKNNIVYYIRNEELILKIKECFEQYRTLNMTLSEYFGRNILYACKNRDENSFMLEGKKNPKNPLLLFKIRRSCLINQNVNDVKSKNPVRMSFKDILEKLQRNLRRKNTGPRPLIPL